MNLTKILSIVLFLVSIGLAYYLYDSIHSTIEFKESIASTEKQITDKLAVIREAEKAFLEQHGHYTADWDSLRNFIENGRVPITNRTEKITQLSYGEEKVEVIIDTIGFMPARDRIFKKNYSVNAAADGTFMGFLVKVNDVVVKGTPAYRLRAKDKEKTDVHNLIEQGTITSTANIKPGDAVTRGQNLISLWDYHLNPNVDIANLGQVPGSEGKMFDIFVGKIDRNGSMVSVIEVKDPAPINPERKASNEAKKRQPLGFGSRLDVGTAGNWE
ncbi:hypothetical protein [Chryseolinea sp. H1M3-3]|uniref:hypothetical protein n=1 Tax=Chryseolinea sp. H1M3-3 TaxID=3034144 RepID=UPI0023EDDEB8|nr:hypothetical protein [Chryseolinea sp. H1M3-3]